MIGPLLSPNHLPVIYVKPWSTSGIDGTHVVAVVLNGATGAHRPAVEIGPHRKQRKQKLSAAREVVKNAPRTGQTAGEFVGQANPGLVPSGIRFVRTSSPDHVCGRGAT